MERRISMAHEPHWFASPPAAFGTRREFLRRAGSGAGMLALTALLGEQGLLVAEAGEASVNPARAARPMQLNPMVPRASHFPAKAKSVIWLFLNGGPSQVDTWDYKPELEKRSGQELPGFDKNTG